MNEDGASASGHGVYCQLVSAHEHHHLWRPSIDWNNGIIVMVKINVPEKCHSKLNSSYYRVVFINNENIH